MRGTDDRLRIGMVGRGWRAFFAVSAVLMGVLAVTSRSLSSAALAALCGAQAFTYHRNATVLTPASLCTGVLRRREVPWGEVAEIRASPSRVEAVLRDGTRVPLGGVVWRAARAPGSGPPGSAQAVAEWARAHGHDVPLVPG